MAGIPLIVTADDYGLTEGTSRAILTAAEHGIVTATSVLAVAPGIGERLRWLEGASTVVPGVHLALVGEDRPLLSAREIPSLVDADGCFRPSWRSLVPLLAAGRVDPADIHREFAAQFELVRGQVEIGHLDTHQHLHLWPTVRRVVIDLAVEHAVPRIRVPRPSQRGLRSYGIGHLADSLAAAVDAAGLQATARFCGLDEAGGWSPATLSRTLTILALEDGSVECNVHPGALVDAERDRFAWGYAWGQELEALLDPGLRRTVDRLGYELVSG